MGCGYTFSCKKCGYKLNPWLGVGFLFPLTYRETIEAAKRGEFGETVQTFLEEHPNGALNCDEVLLQCTECGSLETAKDLSMYVPPDRAEPSKVGRWSVAFPADSDSCVAPWELENYVLIDRYEHKCMKCGAKMKTIDQKALGKRIGPSVSGESQTDIPCPECGEKLRYISTIMWD